MGTVFSFYVKQVLEDVKDEENLQEELIVSFVMGTEMKNLMCPTKINELIEKAQKFL